MRRDGVPLALPLDEHVSETDAGADRCAVELAAGDGSPANDRGIAKQADADVIDDIAVERHRVKKVSEHHCAGEYLSIRLCHAPFRRENALNKCAVVLTPRSRKSLLNIFESLFISGALCKGVDGQQTRSDHAAEKD